MTLSEFQIKHVINDAAGVSVTLHNEFKTVCTWEACKLGRTPSSSDYLRLALVIWQLFMSVS